MSELRIEKLALKLSGISPNDGERLARRIGDRIAAAAPDRDIVISRVGISITANPGDDLDLIANQAAAEMLRRIMAT
jgi:hypothetical protein